MSTIAKYKKIEKAKETTEKNEIRLSAKGSIGRYITYAASLLIGDENKAEKVVIKATGVAIKNACLVAEILRHRILGLHQLTEIKTTSIKDEYEPLEEGLDKVVIERSLAVLEITLSTKAGVLDEKAPGYQAPLPKNEVEEVDFKTLVRGGGRVEDDDGHPRERGRRRGGRGRGRPRSEPFRERRGRGRGERRDRGGRGGRGSRRGGRSYDDDDDMHRSRSNYERGRSRRGGRSYGDDEDDMRRSRSDYERGKPRRGTFRGERRSNYRGEGRGKRDDK